MHGALEWLDQIVQFEVPKEELERWDSQLLSYKIIEQQKYNIRTVKYIITERISCTSVPAYNKNVPSIPGPK